MSSLRGRYYGDCLKRWVLNTLNYNFPVPTYGYPEYWDQAYKDFTIYDRPIEWGNLTYHHLKEYQYRILDIPMNLAATPTYKTSLDPNPNPIQHTTLHETILGATTTTKTTTTTESEEVEEQEEEIPGRIPYDDRHSSNYNDKDDDPILILGCGNSRFGMDLYLSDLYKGPLIQIDVSARIVGVMAQHCNSQIQLGDMMVIQDDARQLSSLSKDNSIASVVDKGTLDSIYCAGYGKQRVSISEEQQTCWDIFQSVYRVLRPNAYFCVWSYAQPELWLPFVLQQQQHRYDSRMWQQIQVRHDVTNDVLLYRFQKAAATASSSLLHLNRKQPTRNHKNNNHKNMRHGPTRRLSW